MPKIPTGGQSQRSTPYDRPQGSAISPTTAARWQSAARKLWDSTQLPPRTNYEKVTGWWRKDPRNVAVLLKKDEKVNLRTPPEEEIQQRGLKALRGPEAYRWTTHNKPDDGLKYFWADETSGRIMEDVIYGSLHRQYGEIVQKIRRDREDIADQVDAAGRDSMLVLLERMLWGIANAKGEDSKTAINAALQHLSLDPLGPNLQVQKLKQENEGLTKQISKLNQELQAKEKQNRLLRQYEASASRYRNNMVDLRLRMTITNLGLNSWNKFDIGRNELARSAHTNIKTIFDKIATMDGGRMAQTIPPFGNQQTMRSTLLSRAIHGEDFLSDCEIIAQGLVHARHGIGARATKAIEAQMPRAVTYSAIVGSQPHGPLDKAWQSAFDATFQARHGIGTLEARYILECLVEGNIDMDRDADGRVEARKTLIGHVEFIDKWLSVFENNRYLASLGMRGVPKYVDQSWVKGWRDLRSAMTNQLFGKQDHSEKWLLRPIFHDYVAYFAQVCQLYNWGKQSVEEWSSELKRLDRARWDVYRLALATWKHDDYNAANVAAEYIKDPVTEVRSRRPGSVQQTIYLWEEFNWIYQHDLWDHPHRRDPKRPHGAPGLKLTPRDVKHIQDGRWTGVPEPYGYDHASGNSQAWAMQQVQDMHEFS